MSAPQPPLLLAGCAVFDEQGRVLIIHRTSPMLTQWEMPGGKIEPGEEPEAAAVREIKEELGVDVNVSKSLGVNHFDFRGRPHEYHYFEATIVKGSPSPQEEKHDDYQYVDLSQLTDEHSLGIKGLKKVLHG